jgi:hypothetical protein
LQAEDHPFQHCGAKGWHAAEPRFVAGSRDPCAVFVEAE